MTNAKTTKSSLLLSSISLLLCFAMLLGTTFAWFTDSATSAGNKIVAGKLDVKLLMDTGSGYEDISNSTDPIFGASSLIAQDNNADTLWEPGKTQVAYLAIKNNGNLALKYTVDLMVENVSKNLYEVMEYDIIEDATFGEVTDWTSGNSVVEGVQAVSGEAVELPVGATHYFALAIHMKEEAGNEYQGGAVNFDLTVFATQLTAEEDSFDDQYDADSEYDKPAITVKASTAEELTEALSEGNSVVLSQNITLDEPIVLNTDAGVELDLGGYTLSGNEDTLIKATTGNITITNGTIKNVNPVATATQVSVLLSGDVVAEVKGVEIETTGKGILLEDNAKITELNATINSHVNANGTCQANAICVNDNARIDVISGGSYDSYYEDEFMNAYTGSFSGTAFYPISVNGADASIGEISGGTFLGMSQDGKNGATVYVNAGKIEKISGGYFGFRKYTFRNYPSVLLNVVGGGSIGEIIGGAFEAGAPAYNGAARFGCDFEGIVAASGSKIEVRPNTLTVTVKFSSPTPQTKQVEVWDVVK